MPSPTKAELTAALAAYRAAVESFVANYTEWRITVEHLERAGKFDTVAQDEWSGQQFRMLKFRNRFAPIDSVWYAALEQRMQAEFDRRVVANQAASPPKTKPRVRRMQGRAGAALRP